MPTPACPDSAKLRGPHHEAQTPRAAERRGSPAPSSGGGGRPQLYLLSVGTPVAALRQESGCRWLIWEVTPENTGQGVEKGSGLKMCNQSGTLRQRRILWATWLHTAGQPWETAEKTGNYPTQGAARQKFINSWHSFSARYPSGGALVARGNSPGWTTTGMARGKGRDGQGPECFLRLPNLPWSLSC